MVFPSETRKKSPVVAFFVFMFDLLFFSFSVAISKSSRPLRLLGGMDQKTTTKSDSNQPNQPGNEQR